MSALDGTVKLPGVGPVSKKVLIPLVGGLAAFVGYRYYVARNAPADDTTATAATDSDFAADGTVPDTLNAIPSDGAYGSSAGEDSGTATTTYGFSGTTNDEWTQYAAAQLEESDVWSYTDIITALGSYLGRRPLSTLQQTIVSSAIAVAGNPPVGSYSIVPGAAPTNNVAPATPEKPTVVGINKTDATATTASVHGAAGYTWYLNGKSEGHTAGNAHKVTGLKAGTKYSLTVEALSSVNLKSKMSPAATFTTKK